MREWNTAVGYSYLVMLLVLLGTELTNPKLAATAQELPPGDPTTGRLDIPAAPHDVAVPAQTTPPLAQPTGEDADKPETPAAPPEESPWEKLRREIAGMEKELEDDASRGDERTAKALAAIEEYRNEQAKAYAELEAQLEQLRLAAGKPGLPLGDEPKKQQLLDQQRRIAIRYGESFRVEDLVRATGSSNEELERRIRTFVAEKLPEVTRQRQALGDEKTNELRSRLNDLIRKSHQASMARVQRAAGFPDVHALSQRGFVDYTGKLRQELQLPEAIEKRREGNETAEPVFGTLHEPLQRLLQLKWRDDCIGLNEEHWDELFGGQDIDTIRRGVQRQLEQKGVSSEVFQQVTRRLPTEPQSHLALLIQDLQSRIKGSESRSNRSGHRSSSNSTWEYELRHGDIRFRASYSPDVLQLELNESSASPKTLSILAYESGRLQISLVGDDLFWLQQSADGSVQVAETFDKEMLYRKASSLLDLYVQYPDYLEANLLPRLDQLGIVPPLQRYDNEVILAVLQRINIMPTEQLPSLDTLLPQLNSSTFEVREAAAKTIAQHVGQYEVELRTRYHQADLPFEVRARIQTLLRNVTAQQGQETQLIDKFGLLKDPQYLIEIMPHVNALSQSLIADHLATITGSDLGPSIEGWQRWLEQSGTHSETP